MSDAKEKAQKLIDSMKGDVQKGIEALAKNLDAKTFALGEVAIELLEDGLPITRESLMEVINRRMSNPQNKFKLIMYRDLHVWLSGLPDPRKDQS